MEQITIFEYINDPIVSKKKKERKKKKEKKTQKNLRMAMCKKIMELQGKNFFGEQNTKLVKRLKRAFKQEIFAYKEEKAFNKIRVILKDGDYFTQGIYDEVARTTYVFLPSHLQGRKSMWEMIQKQWTWRDKESLQDIILYIEEYIMDDSKNNPWAWIFDNAETKNLFRFVKSQKD